MSPNTCNDVKTGDHLHKPHNPINDPIVHYIIPTSINRDPTRISIRAEINLRNGTSCNNAPPAKSINTPINKRTICNLLQQNFSRGIFCRQIVCNHVTLYRSIIP
jgi:hypothetical protein